MSILASPEYVNAGSRVTWTGQFGSFLFSAGADPLIADVTARLKNNFNLCVESSSNNISAGGLGTGSITLSVRTDIDRGDGETDDGLTDILNNINDTFRAVGDAPTASALNNYTAAPSNDSSSGPQQAVTISTGTQAQTVAQQNAAAPKSSSSSWWDSLTGNLAAGSMGFVIGGAAVVVVIIVILIKAE